MNHSKLMNIIVLLLGLAFIGCGNADQDAVRAKARESIPVSTAPTPAANPVTNAADASSAQNANGVWHYTCPAGCAGGAGGAGTCSGCGGELAHNQAFHDNPTASVPTTPITPASSAPPGAPADPNPAQNANGVWHYTCPAGCAGGAGGAGTCSGCGGELAHNQGYHT